MARREPTPDPAPRKSGLTHNPFAALRGVTPEPASAPAPSSPSDAGASSELPSRSPRRTTERVTVRRERAGRGGKTVTIAEGPGLAGHDLEALARDAARGLGTGAREEDAALVVQGDQCDRLVAWLASRGFANVARGN